MGTHPGTSSGRTARAKIACMACRLRKVRCDVACRGSPCTNCFLDRKECRVDNTVRACGRRRKGGERQPAVISPAATTTTTTPPTATQNNRHNRRLNTLKPATHEIPRPQPPPRRPIPEALADLLKNGEDPDAEPNAPWGPGTADISFIGYRFVKTQFIVAIQQDDIKYLEDQACFRVPKREIMDEMLKQFFLHIHPLLPMFDETRFWLMYHPVKYGSKVARGDSMSLFEIQAILFAACSFVGSSKLRRLGFESARHARRCLYRRAKLLYSLDTETDPVSLARGCLLLSLWCPRVNDHRINTMWLSTSVQYARAAQAHCYTELTHLPPRSRSNLKRLWWACMLRDRVMSLGLRRAMHITRDNFNFDAGPLTVEDLLGEEDGPTVYETDINRLLILITVALSEFCSLLTDVLALVYPPAGYVPLRPVESRSNNFLQILRLREDIKAWYREVSRRLPMIPSYERAHPSITLFSCLLQMYYHSTLILLANFEIQLDVECVPPGEQDQARLQQTKAEVRDSSVSIVELLRELVRLDLVKYLPFSAVTCTAQPLVLHLLDQSLARHWNRDSSDVHSRLTVVLQAMKVYQSIYDNTDHVLSTAHRISLEAPSVVEDHTIVGWDDVLAKNPRAYLRLIWTMDLALAKGYFPKDSDLPSTLQASSPESPDSQRTVSEVDSPIDDDSALAVVKPANLPTTGFQATQLPSSDDSLFDDALIMPNSTDSTGGEVANTTFMAASWAEFGCREALMIESDMLVQSMLQSYLEDETTQANVVDEFHANFP